MQKIGNKTKVVLTKNAFLKIWQTSDEAKSEPRDVRMRKAIGDCETSSVKSRIKVRWHFSFCLLCSNMSQFSMFF